MTIQCLIDWKAIFAQRVPADDDRLCAALMRLAEYIRNNGCVVTNDSIRKALVDCTGIGTANLSAALTVWNGVYTDYALQIENDATRTLQGCIASWRTSIAHAGVIEKRGDSRFLLIGGNGCKSKGPFYLACPILMFLDRSLVVKTVPELVQWAGMQHFGPIGKSAFLNYLYAFCASSKSCVRLYDPYLSEMFLPIAKESRRKAWRNSFHLIYSAFAKNQLIHRIEVITTFTSDCQSYLHEDPSHRLRLDEIIEDIILPAFMLRHADLEVSFHILRERSADFHDRFLANGRTCFAIGHGLDVCREGDSFRQLTRQERCGGHVLSNQWRNMPHDDHEIAEFNVFYGCTCKSAPLGVCVFASRMYPQGCSAMKGDDPSLLAKFSFGTICGVTERANVFLYRNERTNTALTVSLNEIVGEDDF